MKSIVRKTLCGALALLAFTGLSGAAAFASEDTLYSAGSGNETISTETFNYANKIVTTYSLPGKAPKYKKVDNLADGCGPVAAAIVLGVLDVKDGNIIPGFTAGFDMGSSIYYSAQNTTVNSLIIDLNNRMGGTVSGAISANGFKNGLSSYLSSVDRTVAYKVVGAGSADLKACIDAGFPAIAMLNRYKYCPDADYSSTGSSDTLKFRNGNLAHVAAVCGYEKVQYFNASGNITATKEYLIVSMGDVSVGRLEVNSSLDQLFTVRI